MIGHFISNYFKNVKYLMLVMGIIFLVLLLGTTVFVRGISYSVNLTASEIVSEANSSDLTFNRVFNVLSGESKEDLFAAIKGVEQNFTGFGNAINNMLGNGVNRVITFGIIFGGVVVLGILIAYITVYCAGLQDRAGKNMFLTWIGAFIKMLIIIALLGGCIYMMLNEKTQNVGLVLLALAPLWYCLLLTLYEWIAAGKNRPPFTKVVTIGHVFALLLTLIITLIITVFITLIILYFFGIITGVFLSLSLVILTFATVSLNAHSLTVDMK